MRRIIVSINSTFNGVVTGRPEDKTDFTEWSDADNIKDVSREFLDILSKVDTILQGRNTFEDLARKWPNVKDWPKVDDTALRMGDMINSMPKVVVGSPEKSAGLTWGEFGPPTVISGNVTKKIEELKHGRGGDIITFGSPTLVRSLLNAGLVDELSIIVYPVIVDFGERLFNDDINGRTDLKMKSVKTFEHGAMIVNYDVSRV